MDGKAYSAREINRGKREDKSKLLFTHALMVCFGYDTWGLDCCQEVQNENKAVFRTCVRPFLIICRFYVLKLHCNEWTYSCGMSPPQAEVIILY